jgi:hypothetical protein
MDSDDYMISIEDSFKEEENGAVDSTGRDTRKSEWWELLYSMRARGNQSGCDENSERIGHGKKDFWTSPRAIYRCIVYC